MSNLLTQSNCNDIRGKKCFICVFCGKALIFSSKHEASGKQEEGEVEMR